MYVVVRLFNNSMMPLVYGPFDTRDKARAFCEGYEGERWIVRHLQEPV